MFESLSIWAGLLLLGGLGMRAADPFTFTDTNAAPLNRRVYRALLVP